MNHQRSPHRRANQASDAGVPAGRPSTPATPHQETREESPGNPCAPYGLWINDGSRPDFGDHYLTLLAGASALSVASSRIRLGGIQIAPRLLLGLEQVRVLVAELNGITMALEAERLAEDPQARARIATWTQLLEQERLEVRSSPLGGWSPDFSVFTGMDTGPVVLLGPHWLERPYPHRGPALNAIHGGPPAHAVLRAFEALWSNAHAVGDAIHRTLCTALERTRRGTGLTPE